MAGLHLGDGQLSITRLDGSVPFDTDGRLFHITDRAINGSRNFPNQKAPQSGTSGRYTHNAYAIGTCNSFATHIVGMFKVSGNDAVIGVPYNTYFDASGSYVHVQSGVAGGNLSGNHTVTGQWTSHTFYCSDGVVYVDETIFQAPVGNATVIIPSHTLTWRLKAGLFT